jgi:hypothetical protein
MLLIVTWYLYVSTWDRYMKSRLMPRPDDSGTRGEPRIRRVANWNISLFEIFLFGFRRVSEPYRNKNGPRVRRVANWNIQLLYLFPPVVVECRYRTQAWAESGTVTSILLLDWIWRVRDGLRGLDWGGYGVNSVGWTETDTGQFFPERWALYYLV